jgi:hypothetical protein
MDVMRSASGYLRLLLALLGLGLQASYAWAQDIECTGPTYNDLLWTVRHEGNSLFGNSSALRPIEDIRRDAAGFESHNGHQAAAKNRILSASTNDMRLYVNCIHLEVKAEIIVHLQWVAFHQQQLEVLRSDAEKGNFADIRAVYSNNQNRNPNAVNLMAGISNDDIKELIDSFGGR